MTPRGAPHSCALGNPGEGGTGAAHLRASTHPNKAGTAPWLPGDVAHLSARAVDHLYPPVQLQYSIFGNVRLP